MSRPGAKKEERRNRARSHIADQGEHENSTRPDAPQTGSVSQVAAFRDQEPMGAQVGRFVRSKYLTFTRLSIVSLGRWSAVTSSVIVPLESTLI
jgi:hypothetical protein